MIWNSHPSLFEKYGQHQPLNRQAERFAREGVPPSVSTLADQVGAAAHALMPLYKLIEAHLLAAARIHGDDTTVPVIAKGKIDVARLGVFVRDDRPFAGTDLPAALFHYSRDRRGEHPQAHLAAWSGILQDDAYGRYGELYREGRGLGPVLEACCFAHARRKFFELADVVSSARNIIRGQRAAMIYPIALEAAQRLDPLFDTERGINGKSPAKRVATRQELSAPLMAELHTWLTEQVAKLSRGHNLTKVCSYMFKRWDAFNCFLDVGRICLTKTAAERALRCIRLGRKAGLFCGSDPGGQRAAIICTLIQTTKLNDVDQQACFADVLARIAEHPATWLDQLLPETAHRTQTRSPRNLPRGPVAITSRPSRVRYPSDCRKLEFVHDQMASDRRSGILNVVDDVIKECLATGPDTSISTNLVLCELTWLIAQRGMLGIFVSDNGTEFTSNAVVAWCAYSGVEWHHSAPANPERLNGRMRNKRLNETLRMSLAHARAQIADCAEDYKRRRPHSALAKQPRWPSLLACTSNRLLRYALRAPACGQVLKPRGCAKQSHATYPIYGKLGLPSLKKDTLPIVKMSNQ